MSYILPTIFMFAFIFIMIVIVAVIKPKLPEVLHTPFTIGMMVLCGIGALKMLPTVLISAFNGTVKNALNAILFFS